MNFQILFTQTSSPSLPDLHLKTKRSLPRTEPPSTLTFLCRNSPHFRLLNLPPRIRNPKVVEAVRLDGPVVEVGELSGAGEGDLVFETCITRTLPPALTIEQGLKRITEAVEKMKMDPTSSANGIFRFQVAVPPSPKALSWFCCQPVESSVYPLFFLSKNTDKPTYKALYTKECCGVFGIGAAIYFRDSSSRTSEERSSTKRYLSSDSTFLTAYGFMEINFNMNSSIMHEAGSSYLFIPQIELQEYEGASILAATIAWSDSSLCSFEEAISSYELSLEQAGHYILPTTEKCNSNAIRSTLRKLNVVEDETLTMVYMNLLSQGGREVIARVMELVSPFS